MKGIPSASQPQLFSRWYDLDEFVPKNHFLRSVKKHVDFSFVDEQIAHLYSDTGRPSIDPIVVFKMLFLIFLYQIPSERRAIDEVRYNLLYRWF